MKLTRNTRLNKLPKQLGCAPFGKLICINRALGMRARRSTAYISNSTLCAYRGLGYMWHGMHATRYLNDAQFVQLWDISEPLYVVSIIQAKAPMKWKFLSHLTDIRPHDRLIIVVCRLLTKVDEHALSLKENLRISLARKCRSLKYHSAGNEGQTSRPHACWEHSVCKCLNARLCLLHLPLRHPGASSRLRQGLSVCLWHYKANLLNRRLVE